MFWLKVVCWAYLIFTLMGRIVNYDKNDKQSNKVRCIDNVMIVVLIAILYFLIR